MVGQSGADERLVGDVTVNAFFEASGKIVESIQPPAVASD
jgi:hypothetical protein